MWYDQESVIVSVIQRVIDKGCPQSADSLPRTTRMVLNWRSSVSPFDRWRLAEYVYVLCSWSWSSVWNLHRLLHPSVYRRKQPLSRLNQDSAEGSIVVHYVYSGRIDESIDKLPQRCWADCIDYSLFGLARSRSSRHEPSDQYRTN